MHMHRAFRLAGGARGVEPERHVVAQRRRGVVLRLVGADDILEQPIAFCVKILRIIAGDDDVLEVRALFDQFLEFREQRFRHHQAFGPAVRQHEAVVVLGQQRVDRHGDDAGLQAAKKCDRPVHGVEQRQQHAFFAPYAQTAQCRAEARDAVGELAVGQRAARVDIGGLVGAAGREVALQHVGGEIVIAWDLAQKILAHWLVRTICRRCFRGCHCFSSPDLSVLCRGGRNAAMSANRSHRA